MHTSANTLMIQMGHPFQDAADSRLCIYTMQRELMGLFSDTRRVPELAGAPSVLVP